MGDIYKNGTAYTYKMDKINVFFSALKLSVRKQR